MTDAAALKDANISLSQPITIKLEGATLKSALNLILHQAHLGYQVQNHTLVITTPKLKLEPRVYPVLDLVSPVVLRVTADDLSGNHKGTLEDVLIELIQNTIEPQTWRKMDGPATIEYFKQGKSLVVYQTAENHEQVQELLNALRRLQDQHAVAETSDCGPKPSMKVPSLTCETAACPQMTQLWDPWSQPAPAKTVQIPGTQPTFIVIQQPSSELAFAMWAACTFAEWAGNEFANKEVGFEEDGFHPIQSIQQTQAQVQPPLACSAPAVPNVAPALQQLPIIVTRDANGITRVGVDFGSCATGPSPLPAPVPTFRVPPAVACEMNLPTVQGYSYGYANPIPAVSTPTNVTPYEPPARVYHDQAVPLSLMPLTPQAVAPPTQAMNQASTLQRTLVSYPMGTVTYPGLSAIPVCYVPPAMPSPVEKKSTWTMRVHADGERPSMSARCGSASMVCSNLAVKWKENATLLFEAEKKCIRIRGNDFEAEAEAVECQESEGRLVLTGNVRLTHYENGKCDCSVHADRVVWGSEGIVLKAPGSSK